MEITTAKEEEKQPLIKKDEEKNKEDAKEDVESSYAASSGF